MLGDGAMVPVTYSFTCLTVLAWLTGFAADGSLLPRPEKLLSVSPRREQEVNQLQLNTSALNTALAFAPYRDLATRSTAGPGIQRHRPHNILFSPVGLASALALLSRVSGAESRSQALEALGLAANSTEQRVEAAVSALTDLQRSLALQEGAGVQRAEAGVGIGDAAGADPGGADAGNRTDIDGGAEGGAGADHGVRAGGKLRVLSSLHVDGKPSLDYDGFLSNPELNGSATFSFDALTNDSQSSDKLELHSYVYFKGRQPFERRHTVPRSFQLNATASVDVPMMFRDDTSDVMMLYDTNCSATVVRLAYSERLASLLLLPKGELQPLEDCLSDSRMSFWRSNLKPGRAEIRFPKFQLRKSHSLENLLRNARVSAIFSDAADFSGISPKKMLRLVKAHHEVMLEVEESNSEDGGRPDIDFSFPARIDFNRPFMFIIYDDLTGLILLMGRVIDPTDV